MSVLTLWLRPENGCENGEGEKEGGAARRRLLGGCKLQPTGDWACALFNPPPPTDYCVRRAAAAQYCGSQPLFQVRNLAAPRAGAACAGLQRARTGRQAPGHLLKILHGPWVTCPAPCLVHIAACRCACPISQAPPALRALCRGWIQRACAGRQAPVHPRDTSPGPWAESHVSHLCCLGRLRAAPSLYA